jgi:serine/threonine protein kinase
VTEFINGGSLFDWLDPFRTDLGVASGAEYKGPCEPPPSVLVRLRMMRQTSLAMQYLHSKAICHRDIKSLNVLCEAGLGSDGPTVKCE